MRVDMHFNLEDNKFLILLTGPRSDGGSMIETLHAIAESDVNILLINSDKGENFKSLEVLDNVLVKYYSDYSTGKIPQTRQS